MDQSLVDYALHVGNVSPGGRRLSVVTKAGTGRRRGPDSRQRQRAPGRLLRVVRRPLVQRAGEPSPGGFSFFPACAVRQANLRRSTSENAGAFPATSAERACFVNLNCPPTLNWLSGTRFQLSGVAGKKRRSNSWPNSSNRARTASRPGCSPKSRGTLEGDNSPYMFRLAR